MFVCVGVRVCRRQHSLVKSRIGSAGIHFAVKLKDHMALRLMSQKLASFCFVPLHPTKWLACCRGASSNTSMSIVHSRRMYD